MLEDNAIWLAIIAFTSVTEGVVSALMANWLESRQLHRNQEFALAQEEREHRRSLEAEEREYRRSIEKEEREYQRAIETEEREYQRELSKANESDDDDSDETEDASDLLDLEIKFDDYRKEIKEEIKDLYSMVHSLPGNAPQGE